jgi:hypothetical protein
MVLFGISFAHVGSKDAATVDKGVEKVEEAESHVEAKVQS